jgi:hypothetical protein
MTEVIMETQIETKPADLFADWEPQRKILEGALAPAIAGLICGVLMTVSGVAYLVVALLCWVGGFPLGGQHRTIGGALARAAVAASIWAALVLAFVHLSGRTPVTPLPDPEISFFLFAIVPTALLAAVSWFVAKRKQV